MRIEIMSKGIDYSAGPIPGHVLVENGIHFVGRYLSHNPKKNLTGHELLDLKASGIDIFLIWETTTSRPLTGYDAGVQDAKDALKQAQALSNDARVIYFACDNDYSDADLQKAGDYFEGVAEVLALHQIGVYGGYKTVKYMLDNNLVTYAWQTYAWSHGKWDNRAQLRQTNIYGPKLAGIDCDTDENMADDFGQF